MRMDIYDTFSMNENNKGNTRITDNVIDQIEPITGGERKR